MDNGNCYAKFNPCATGMAFGILWSLSLVMMAIMSACCGNWGGDFVKLMANLYIGYGTSFLGILAGLVWGFVDGFIGGFIFAWLYNKILDCNCSKCFCLRCKCRSSNTGTDSSNAV